MDGTNDSRYQLACRDLQKQQRKSPRASWFHVCEDWPTEDRAAMVRRFEQDGYAASVTDQYQYGCGSNPGMLHCVTVCRK